jgi:signal transduction histidine kinase
MLALCTAAAAIHVAKAVPVLIIDLGVLVVLYTVAIRYAWTISLAILTGLVLLVTGWSLYAAANALPVPGLPDQISNAKLRSDIGGLAPPPSNGPRKSVRQDAWTGVFVLGSALLASWAIGSGARSRRAYLDQLHARAQDLERERDQQTALATAAERARISRELHDVVAHGLSVIVTLAQGAAAALDNKRPADTRNALGAIVKTGRDSLTDMRTMLAKVDGVDTSWHPQPGLDDLPALIDQVRVAGTPVSLRIEGTPAAAPPAVDLSAYRIVQEALTNTIKHAGAGATATVVISYRAADLTIDINDDGHGVINGNGGGNGLTGMHERARLLGGRFAAGPGPTGGYAVHAVLPIQELDA